LKARRRSSRPVALRKRERLLAGLPDLREVLRGSLITRYRRCGRPNCHCARPGDPGHGPVYSLMVTVAPKETLEVYVTKEQKTEVEARIKGFNKVRKILEEISSINRTLLQEKQLFPEE
jgi:hypothetical protein